MKKYFRKWSYTIKLHYLLSMILEPNKYIGQEILRERNGITRGDYTIWN